MKIAAFVNGAFKSKYRGHGILVVVRIVLSASECRKHGISVAGKMVRVHQNAVGMTYY